jgi:hypothetical protein
MRLNILKGLFILKTFTKKQMSTIKINGRTFSGHNLSIANGTITIDGMRQDGDTLSGVVRVEITGNVANVECDAPLVINGNVTGDVDADGPVTCGDVHGDVGGDGPITCGNVGGDVEADGPVTCGNVGGDVIAEIVTKS